MRVSKLFCYKLVDSSAIASVHGRNMPFIPRYTASQLEGNPCLVDMAWMLHAFEDGQWLPVDFYPGDFERTEL